MHPNGYMDQNHHRPTLDLWEKCGLCAGQAKYIIGKVDPTSSTL
jgi:hypothetical protein